MSKTLDIRRAVMECLLDDRDEGSVSVTTSTGSVTVPVNFPGIESRNTDGNSIEVTIPVAEQSDPTLGGNALIDEEGSILATVVTEGTDYKARNFIYAAADKVGACFSVGTIDSSSVSGVNIQITARPSIRPLYRDDNHLRLPVVIRYRASRDV